MRNYRILLRGMFTAIVTLLLFSPFSSYAKSDSFTKAQPSDKATENVLSDIFESKKATEKTSSGLPDFSRLPDFAKLAKQASPAVVNIRTLVKPKQIVNPFDNPNVPSPFADLFRRFYEEQEQRSASKKPVPKYLGSGFILSKDGYILTNAHVIKDADEIMVKLIDRREFKAKLIGSDEKTDLALLKIDASNLPSLQLGNSDRLQQGQWVMAIGSPYGLDYTVTKGIISALNRSLSNASYVPFIQTDVPINPGNSGGPLIDLQGNVIGVNSQIVTTSGGFMGLSFAIPADEANYVVSQLKTHGKVERGWLGVTFQDIDQNLAKSFKLPHPEGALVSQVVPESPAAKAGFKSGDIILKFNNYKIMYFTDLPAIVGRIPVGTKTKARVWRNGKLVDIEVTIEKPSTDREPETGAKLSEYLGVRVQDLNELLRQKLNVKNNDITGVVITHVPKDSIGEEWGLLPDDIITELGNGHIANTQDFNKADAKLAGEKKKIEAQKNNTQDSNIPRVQIRIIRRGQAIFLAFPIANMNKDADKSGGNN